MKKVKFSVFADLHHEPKAFMSNAWEKLALIQQRADLNDVDFIIHAGDLTHGPSHYEDFVNFYNNFHIPSYNCLGNHDSDNTSYEETVKYYKMPNGYYHFDVNGFRFIVLNPNYFQEGNEYITYSLGNYYASPNGSAGFMPPFELEWLKEKVMEFDGSCILISHQSFERVDGVINKDEVMNLICECNSIRENAIIMCINGHYHRDYIIKKNGVLFFDLNSCSYDWIDQPHKFYPKKLCRKFSCMKNTIIVNEPVHAIVELDENGGIKIDGMEGTFFMGITRSMTNAPILDDAFRAYTARVSSYKNM